MKRDLLTRLAAGFGVALLAAGLLTAPARAEEKLERKVKIKVMADGMTDTAAIDVSDLAVGETRWVSTDSGKDVGITREEEGYRISIDGEETFVVSPGAGSGGLHHRMAVYSGDGGLELVQEDDRGPLHHRMAFHSGDGDGKARQVLFRRLGTVEEGGVQSMVFVSDQNQVIHLPGASDTVFISGLGDLDELQKQAIIDALRSAGVEKEVRFAPAAGHGFRFISGEGAAPGEDVDINVKTIQSGDAEAPRVIVIEQVETKQE